MINTKFKKLITSLVLSSVSLSTIPFATVMATPSDSDIPTEVQNTETKDLERKIVGYFHEWAYKSEAQGYFNVTDLQWDELTHIQYSFAMIDPATNKVKLGDEVLLSKKISQL